MNLKKQSNTQNEQEMIGRRVDQLRIEQGLTIEELAGKMRIRGININYLSQILQGQALAGIPINWKKGFVIALGLIEARGGIENLSSEDLDSLLLPETPDEQISWQTEMNL